MGSKICTVCLARDDRERAEPWLAGDVAVNNLTLAGLPIPSVIRAAKIATIEVADMQLGSAACRQRNAGRSSRDFRKLSAFA